MCELFILIDIGNRILLGWLLLSRQRLQLPPSNSASTIIMSSVSLWNLGGVATRCAWINIFWSILRLNWSGRSRPSYLMFLPLLISVVRIMVCKLLLSLRLLIWLLKGLWRQVVFTLILTEVLSQKFITVTYKAITIDRRFWRLIDSKALEIDSRGIIHIHMRQGRVIIVQLLLVVCPCMFTILRYLI